jgi:hypothetical protein
VEPAGAAAGDEIARDGRDDGGRRAHTNELRVHVKGALTNGCTAEQIQDILLLVAMYCGIPAANEPIALRSMCCARPKRPNRAPAVLRFLQLGFVWPGLGVPAECREAKPSGTRAGNCYDC